MSTRPDIRIAWLTWPILGLTLLLLTDLRVVSDRFSYLTFAWLGLAHVVSVFWRHGGRYITAPGVFAIGIGLFVHFPALYYAWPERFEPTPAFTLALTGTYFGHLVLHHLWWTPRSPSWTSPEAVAKDPEPAVTTWTFHWGILLVAAGFVGESFLGMGGSTPAGAAMFLGITMLATAVITARGHLSLGRLLLASAAFIVYVSIMYTGAGRLVLAALALSLVMVLAQKRPTRTVKAATLVAIPVGLIVLARERAQDVAASHGAVETGLESVVWPYHRFVELVQLAQASALELAGSSTFVATALAFVPRSVWPQKPVGLGAELTGIFQPTLVGTGHSEAALLQGEWVYSFGVVGLLWSVPFIALFIGWLDRWQYSNQVRLMDTRRAMLSRVATIVAVSGLLDLVWVGTFTYMSRTGMRLGLLLIIFVLFASARQKSRLIHTGRVRPRRSESLGSCKTDPGGR